MCREGQQWSWIMMEIAVKLQVHISQLLGLMAFLATVISPGGKTRLPGFALVTDRSTKDQHSKGICNSVQSAWVALRDMADNEWGSMQADFDSTAGSTHAVLPLTEMARLVDNIR